MFGQIYHTHVGKYTPWKSSQPNKECWSYIPGVARSPDPTKVQSLVDLDFLGTSPMYPILKKLGGSGGFKDFLCLPRMIQFDEHILKMGGSPTN